MTSLHEYTFNNMGRIGNDNTDKSQRTIQNTRFNNYMLSDFNSEKTANSHVNFATSQPVMMNSASHVSGQVIDVNSYLLLNKEQFRPFEKQQLHPRLFNTIPYLGRGSVDPTLESQLLHGELVSDKKSVSTIMEKSFNDYSLYPVDSNMSERLDNSSYTIQEDAQEGWFRGGKNSRDINYIH